VTATARRRGLHPAFVVVCIAVGVLVAIWGALFFAAWSVHQTERSVATYTGVDLLRIDGGSGNIAVIGEDRDDVEVVTRISWGLKKPDVVRSFDGGALKLSGGCDFLGSFGPDGCDADFEVHVPRDLQVDLRGGSGDVNGRGLAGRANLGTRSGNATAVDGSGLLHVSATSGDVVVEGFRGRDVTAEATSGNVTVRTRSVPDRVEATATSGDVTVVVPGSVAYYVEADAASGGTDVAVDQSRRSKRVIRARATSGNVHVARLDDAR